MFVNNGPSSESWNVLMYTICKILHNLKNVSFLKNAQDCDLSIEKYELTYFSLLFLLGTLCFMNQEIEIKHLEKFDCSSILSIETDYGLKDSRVRVRAPAGSGIFASSLHHILYKQYIETT
jgi:hypothetical protein